MPDASLEQKQTKLQLINGTLAAQEADVQVNNVLQKYEPSLKPMITIHNVSDTCL